MFFGLFGKKVETPQRLPDSEHTKELKSIWVSLDQELKEFAKTTRDLGLDHNCKICFNEKGMANLVKQLREIGYDIRLKEEYNDER